MKKYTVPITYMCLHYEEVEAENIQQAVNKATNNFLSKEDNKYIQDSFELDADYLEENYPEERVDWLKYATE